MRAAIADHQLVLHFQPIIHLRTGQTEGFEALVRWRRLDGSLVPPIEFIPVAEQSDLICDLDSWVLEHAVAQLAGWNSLRGSTDLVLAVNISPRHLSRSRVVTDVTSALVAAGVDARQLVLEITETAVIDNPAALEHLADLRRLGVSISIDDFGSGYSSISLLETLPVDIVKIDKRFLDRRAPASDLLLRLIVQAAHAYGLPVVAEGVERDDQLALLEAIDCESAQGYFLGRPVENPDILTAAVLPVGALVRSLDR